jgi:hypothetical protein
MKFTVITEKTDNTTIIQLQSQASFPLFTAQFLSTQQKKFPPFLRFPSFVIINGPPPEKS